MADDENDEQDTPATTTQDTPAAPGGEDEAHRKFREALEKKKAGRHASDAGGPTATGVGPAENTKTTRQFRRKSGG